MQVIIEGATGTGNPTGSINSFTGACSPRMSNTTEFRKYPFTLNNPIDSITLFTWCGSGSTDVAIEIDDVAIPNLPLPANWDENSGLPSETTFMKSLAAGVHSIRFAPTTNGPNICIRKVGLNEVVVLTTPTPTITSTTMVAGTPTFTCTTVANAVVYIYKNGATTASQTVTADSSGNVNVALSFVIVSGDVITSRAKVTGSVLSAVSNQVVVTASTAPSFAPPTPAPAAIPNGATASASSISGCTNLPAGCTFSILANSATNCNPSVNALGVYSAIDTGGAAAHQMTFTVNVKDSSGVSIGTVLVTIPVGAALAQPTYASSITGTQILNASVNNSGSGTAGSSNIPAGSVFSILSGSQTNCAVSINATTGAYLITDVGGAAAHSCSFTIQIKDTSGNVIATIPVTTPVAASATVNSGDINYNYAMPLPYQPTNYAPIEIIEAAVSETSGRSANGGGNLLWVGIALAVAVYFDNKK